jgi:hypothetical protein
MSSLNIERQYITKDNVLEVTSNEERSNIKEFCMCSLCDHPLELGVHDLTEAEDLLFGYKATIRRCRVIGCDCVITVHRAYDLGNFELPPSLEEVEKVK